MEDAAVAEKPWQLTGEVKAGARPVNTLLEHDLEFEQQTKQGISKFIIKTNVMVYGLWGKRGIFVQG